MSRSGDRKNKKLMLNRETLRQLTEDQLRRAGGGNNTDPGGSGGGPYGASDSYNGSTRCGGYG